MFGKSKQTAQDDSAQDSVDNSVDELMATKSAPVLDDKAASPFIMTSADDGSTSTHHVATPAYPSDFTSVPNPVAADPVPPVAPKPPEPPQPPAPEPVTEPEPTPVPLPPTPDGAARVPVTITQKPMPNPSFVPTNAPAPEPPQPPEPLIRTGLSDDLQALKQQALQQLSPLVDQLEQSPEEKYRTTMMMLQATDDQNLVRVAYEAAQDIADEKVRAQALLDVINEINYFTQKNAQAEG